jgi:hypothetical protein
MNIGHFNTAKKYIRLLEGLHLLKVEKRGGRYRFHILSSLTSITEERGTQKMNVKEYPIKEYSKKDRGSSDGWKSPRDIMGKIYNPRTKTYVGKKKDV